jgi:hypothetical protein
LDFAKREICLGPCFIPTGNVKEDMDQIRDFYKGVQAKYPEMTTPIRLIDEKS